MTNYWITLNAGHTWRRITKDEYVNLNRVVTDPDSDGYFEEEIDFASPDNWVEGRIGDTPQGDVALMFNGS